MFSVSPSEILTIALVALLVFGPRRLPEIARRVGKVWRELMGAAQELKSGLEKEYDEVAKPLGDVRRELGATVSEEDPMPLQRPEEPPGENGAE